MGLASLLRSGWSSSRGQPVVSLMTMVLTCSFVRGFSTRSPTRPVCLQRATRGELGSVAGRGHVNLQGSGCCLAGGGAGLPREGTLWSAHEVYQSSGLWAEHGCCMSPAHRPVPWWPGAHRCFQRRTWLFARPGTLHPWRHSSTCTRGEPYAPMVVISDVERGDPRFLSTARVTKRASGSCSSAAITYPISIYSPSTRLTPRSRRPH